MLNMATRWVDGRPAHKWTKRTIDDAFEFTAESRRRRSALEDIADCVIGET